MQSTCNWWSGYHNVATHRKQKQTHTNDPRNSTHTKHKLTELLVLSTASVHRRGDPPASSLRRLCSKKAEYTHRSTTKLHRAQRSYYFRLLCYVNPVYWLTWRTHKYKNDTAEQQHHIAGARGQLSRACDVDVLRYPSCKSIYSELLCKLRYVRSYTRENDRLNSSAPSANCRKRSTSWISGTFTHRTWRFSSPVNTPDPTAVRKFRFSLLGAEVWQSYEPTAGNTALGTFRSVQGLGIRPFQEQSTSC